MVLGLSLAFGDQPALEATLLLALIAGVSYAAHEFTSLSAQWSAPAEALLVGAVIGLTMPDGSLLLPYLVVPPMLAGVHFGWRSVTVTCGVAAASLMVSMTLADGSVPDKGFEVSAPWIIASLGVGLVSHWIYRLRGDFSVDEESYASARRLLSQLRTVTRRLSSGLDPVSISQQVLQVLEDDLAAARSAVFVRTQGGVLSPLAYRGHGAKEAIRADGAMVEEVLQTTKPVGAAQESGLATCRYRHVLPLQLGDRLVGIAVADCPAPAGDGVLHELVGRLDEQALRLDTALVWDELRSLATLEERQRLAREIHDGVAQELASLGYLVDDLAATSPSEPHRVRLQSLRSEITRVVSELRLSIFDLRSEVTTSGGLGSALSDYVRAVGARSGMTVHLTLDEEPTRLRADVEAELLRIAQEAITNARKHSKGGNLWVDCRIHPPSAHISVQDDGGGLGAARPDSYGLMIMRERAERVGAVLAIGEELAESGDKGTRVAVTID